jgi:glycosyltransferase involved in cell wall biosynthesis
MIDPGMIPNGLLPVTVVVPVKNEERNLPTCLERVRGFAEVLVVDSNSTDRTLAIARDSGATVLQFAWDGRFPKKRNWVLQNHAFKTPWALFLDADEYVTPAFVEELRRVLPTTSHAGFWITYGNVFMGRELRFGGPMTKLALIRVGSGEYERIEEEGWSGLDMEVHEHPVLAGSVGRITARIEHNDFKGLRAYIARHNEYSSWEAARYTRLAHTPEAWHSFTPAQQRKYRSLGSWWLAPAYFFYCYVWKQGFRDGFAGFAFAVMKGIYLFQTRLKIIELRGRRQAAA